MLTYTRTHPHTRIFLLYSSSSPKTNTQMHSSFHLTFLLLCCTVFLHPTPCLSSRPSKPSPSSSPLILPLKAAQIPSHSLPRPQNKLSFHHNVSLTVTVSAAARHHGPRYRQRALLAPLPQDRQSATTPLSFSPSLSSSYRPIPCSSPTCTTRTRDFTVPASCDSNKLCHAVLSYADASSVEGNLATDNFHLDASISNPFTGLVFGCMDSGSSSNPEDSKTTGLIGMNRGSLSLVSQTGFNKFSYCISGRDSSGVLLFGDADFPWLTPLNYTPLVQMTTPLPYFDRVAYTVQLEGIRVGSTILPLPKSVYVPDHTGAGQTMVDSGTQFTFLLGPVYTALRNEFLKQTKGILRQLEDPNFVFEGAMDLCYRVEAGKKEPLRLPAVTLMFKGVEMSVYGEKLLYRVPGMSRGGDTVHCLTFGNSDLLGVEAYVIGHHHQQNMWMEFDLLKSRVGLAEFSCDLAAQKLGL